MIKKLLTSILVCLSLFIFVGCFNDKNSFSNISTEYSTISATTVNSQFFENKTFSIEDNFEDVKNKISNSETERYKYIDNVIDLINISALPLNRIFPLISDSKLDNSTSQKELTNLTKSFTDFYDSLEKFRSAKTRIEDNTAQLDFSNSIDENTYNNFVSASNTLIKGLQIFSNNIVNLYIDRIANHSFFNLNSTTVLDGLIECKLYQSYFKVLIPSTELFFFNMYNSKIISYGNNIEINNFEYTINTGKKLYYTASINYINKSSDFSNLKNNYFKLEEILDQNGNMLKYLMNSISNFNFQNLEENVIVNFGEYNATNMNSYINNKLNKEQKGHYIFVCNALQNNCNNILKELNSFIDYINE